MLTKIYKSDARKFFFTLVFTILLSVIGGFELPFLQTCTIEDEKCHIEQVDKFFELYGNGIKELDIPPLDPMPLGDIKINGNSNENFNLQLLMQNVILYKFPKVKCLSLKGFNKDPSKPVRTVMKVFSPQLIIKARCKVNGKLLLFTVAGETDLKVDMTNVTTTVKTKLTPYKKDGLWYFKALEMKPKLDIKSILTTFSNSTLFNGEEIFMKTFEDTINANGEVLRDEIEPHLNEAVGKIEIEILNKVLATMSYDKYFKKSE